jgi:hypothetical protein
VESWFPKEHIIDYMNLPYDDREKFLPFCVWYDEEPDYACYGEGDPSRNERRMLELYE